MPEFTVEQFLQAARAGTEDWIRKNAPLNNIEIVGETIQPFTDGSARKFWFKLPSGEYVRYEPLKASSRQGEGSRGGKVQPFNYNPFRNQLEEQVKLTLGQKGIEGTGKLAKKQSKKEQAPFARSPPLEAARLATKAPAMKSGLMFSLFLRRAG